MDAVRVAFKPEFLNRLDDVVVFDALGMEELVPDRRAAGRARSARRLAERRLTLDVTPAAREWLALTGLRPGVRRPAAAPAGAARDRRPARQGAARRRDPRRRHASLVDTRAGRRRRRRRPGGLPAPRAGAALGAS